MFSDCIHVLCLFLTHTVQFQKYHIAFHHFSFCKVSNKSITSQSCSEWLCMFFTNVKNILIVLVSFAQANPCSEKCPSCFENCIKSGETDIPAVRIAAKQLRKTVKACTFSTPPPHEATFSMFFRHSTHPKKSIVLRNTDTVVCSRARGMKSQ